MTTILRGRTAIVTGASKGIGRAVAMQFAAEGMQVVILARSQAALEQVAEEASELTGGLIPLPCDVSDQDQVEKAVTVAGKHLGHIDLLVNNAGAFLEAPVTDISAEDWEYAFRVNTTAPFLFCKFVLPLMQDRGSGRIINVCSTASHQGYLHQSAYCASKHALLGFSRCLAIEAKPHGIHVNTVCPGGVSTDFIAGTYLSSRLDGQTMLQPEDVAQTILFLAQQPDNVDIPDVVMRRCHRADSK